ncbi:glycosyltransferase family 4 protein [Pedobacter sp. KLB.chiD]|uniref:glycosyltransferase family 4 protein n=1 Tax=Pedobacter sp. KLB.chiD TaxID=3387402 RepID=UPI003999E089
MPKKLAIIITHPIQYYAPVFQLLAKQLEIKVFYTWGEKSLSKYDKGFNQHIEWDIPLLKGYDHVFLKNSAKDQGTHHFNGIVNPYLINTIQNYKPDAILVYGWAWYSHLKAIRFFKGKIPVYFRGDSNLLHKLAGIKGFLRGMFLKWVYHHVDLAFYVGSANWAYFKAFGLKEKQLVFAPHAIDNNRFGVDRSAEAANLRNRFKVAEDEILVLFAGKLESVKNILLLLTAFQALNLRQVHLLFVGNGHLENSLRESLDKTSQKIHFLNFQNQSQMPAIYQACDLFCLPSKKETWGLAVNEAMAAGKAILVSDKVGCAADLVNPGVNGAVFKSGDLTDLKQNLKILTENKTKLTQMGLASQKIIQDWSFENQVNAIVDAIQNKHAK